MPVSTMFLWCYLNELRVNKKAEKPIKLRKLEKKIIEKTKPKKID
jgi:hypothetical protein